MDIFYSIDNKFKFVFEDIFVDDYFLEDLKAPINLKEANFAQNFN